MILEKKGGIGLSLSWFVTFFIIIGLLLLLFAGGSYAKSKNFILSFGNAKSEIEMAKSISCEKELQDILIKFTKSYVIIDEVPKEVGNSIAESKVSLELFKTTAEEFFSDEFPESSWEGMAHPWSVKIFDSNGDVEKAGAIKTFWAGGLNCYNKEDISSEIIVGDKKVFACLTKVYCEKIK